jgi:putative tryptophan/tyrosine transport system substrate-binding protein
MMKRREFITLLGGAAAAWPLAARAQQADRMRRTGVLSTLSVDGPEMKARLAAFQQALEQLGSPGFACSWSQKSSPLL